MHALLLVQLSLPFLAEEETVEAAVARALVVVVEGGCHSSAAMCLAAAGTQVVAQTQPQEEAGLPLGDPQVEPGRVDLPNLPRYVGCRESNHNCARVCDT